jgi:hypothetical protein
MPCRAQLGDNKVANRAVVLYQQNIHKRNPGYMPAM